VWAFFKKNLVARQGRKILECPKTVRDTFWGSVLRKQFDPEWKWVSRCLGKNLWPSGETRLFALQTMLAMKLDAQQLFQKLTQGYGLVGQKGVIKFTLKDLSIEIESKDSVGNLVQEWLKAWMQQEGLDFEESSNSQTFPDIFLDKTDHKKGLLEIKTFDADRGPGFDLANFESYCNSLLTNAYRLDSEYLIIAYRMVGAEISIENVWLKKIWELTGASSTYPLKVQEKKKIIFNIRPIIWYSERVQFKPFESKEAFLAALNETRYKYAKTRFDNSHWLDEVLKNYAAHTGTSLSVKNS
jgi:hypothetical protein